MEKMQTGQRIITTLPVHGHQNRLIYALTMLLIAKIIIFWLLGIRQGGMHDNRKNWENDEDAPAYTVSYPIAFPNACFTITGSPERNKNDRYAYRTGYHIIQKNSSQFRYAIGTEQQGQYFEWVAIGY